ncbi:hypothetical protein Taro_000113 [Colocasia esculenta]|uniref:Uncharacterized protein n=1 Tax=Colocasia esculenta TaxID=4460 RepID=A0A843TGJ6_COLES|nr:hypothetical protein [Colocasia esculenta]
MQRPSLPRARQSDPVLRLLCGLADGGLKAGVGSCEAAAELAIWGDPGFGMALPDVAGRGRADAEVLRSWSSDDGKEADVAILSMWKGNEFIQFAQGEICKLLKAPICADGAGEAVRPSLPRARRSDPVLRLLCGLADGGLKAGVWSCEAAAELAIWGDPGFRMALPDVAGRGRADAEVLRSWSSDDGKEADVAILVQS